MNYFRYANKYVKISVFNLQHRSVRFFVYKRLSPGLCSRQDGRHLDKNHLPIGARMTLFERRKLVRQNRRAMP